MPHVALGMSHFHRERNFVADGLAKLGANGFSSLFTEMSALPWIVASLVHLDKLGPPSLCF